MTQPKNNYQALIKDAYLEIKSLQAKIASMEKATAEPIAIIGVGCRFPGNVKNLESYWELLKNGTDAITEVPKERWDIDEYYDKDPEAPGKVYTRFGGFISDAEKFDASFFGISEKEASAMDPQQRLLLEVAWEALEDAGQVPAQLMGSKTGLIVGMGTDDYSYLSFSAADPTTINPYSSLGTARSIAVGRVAYMLGFQGPVLQLDTACSSSLLAIHLACQSLRNNECTMALAGGVNLMLSPVTTIAFCKLKALAPDGRGKTFDASADGYSRGEGVGVVVLKKLSTALKDGDNILAVVKGSAVNHDGRSNGLTAPNGAAQEELIKTAIENAGIRPADVQYVEAHGTGTALGDPIEVLALGNVYGEGRSKENPLIVGAVKTNVGHLESAAGMAGLAKIILSMKNKAIPPNVHFKNHNPFIPWEKLPVKVATGLIPWNTDGKARVAGISAFGMSGTNAHLIIEEGPGKVAVDSSNKRSGASLLTLSAKSEDSLKDMAKKYARFLSEHNNISLEDFCYTSNVGRSHFQYRLAIPASKIEDLSKGLSGFLTEGNLASGNILKENLKKPPVAFLFTGQGSQYPNMARSLYERESVFKNTLDYCASILNAYLDKKLFDILFPDDAGSTFINNTMYAQPALFAVEFALAQLLISWGVKPSYVMGHSVGEYVAACIAGVFSPDDGMKLIAARGRLMQSVSESGEMYSVFANEEIVSRALSPYTQSVSIAAFNAPGQIVISGESMAIREVLKKLESSGVTYRRLEVSHAFHSPLMEPILERFEQVASTIKFSPPQINIVSNVTGEIIDSEITSPAYWSRHIIAPVQFIKSVTTIENSNCDIFVEIGPRPILLSLVRDCLQGGEQICIPTLRPGGSNDGGLTNALAALYERGVNLDWKKFFSGYTYQKINLPNYAFQPVSYWINKSSESISASCLPQNLKGRFKPNSFSGFQLKTASSKESIFENEIGKETFSFLYDHIVFSKAIVPGAAFIEMALASAAKVYSDDNLVVQNLRILQPLKLDEQKNKKVQVILSPDQNDSNNFQIYSLDDTLEEQIWILHAKGHVKVNKKSNPGLSETLSELKQKVREEIDIAYYYQDLASRGINYGPQFQGIKSLKKDGRIVLAQIELPHALGENVLDTQCHPVLMDSCFQALGCCLDDRNTYLPVGAEQVILYKKAGRALWCYGRLEAVKEHRLYKAELKLFDVSGELVGEIKDLTVAKADPKMMVGEEKKGDQAPVYYQVSWEAQKRPELSILENKTQGSWLIFLKEGNKNGKDLIKYLEEHGENYTIVSPGTSYAKLSTNHFTVKSDSSDYDLLFAKEGGLDVSKYKNIVHLWCLNDGSEENLSSIKAAQSEGTISILNLIQAMVRVKLDQSSNLFILTRGTQATQYLEKTCPANATVWGLARVVELEYPHMPCFRIDLSPEYEIDEMSEVIKELVSPDIERQLAFRNGTRLVGRFKNLLLDPYKKKMKLLKEKAFELKIAEYGIWESMQVVPKANKALLADEVEIEVCATGLNFRDVLNALGMLAEFTRTMGIESAEAVPFGFECSGKVISKGSNVHHVNVGDEVIAVLAVGSLSGNVHVKADYVVLKPSSLSFEEAATIPLTFLTAYYGLAVLAKIKAGDKVLIHAGAGGVGMAAIQLAKEAGAEIYVTASPGKWEYLRSLGIKHIMNSRTIDFSGELMELTEGKGVDIVLNSLNGEFIPASIEVCKEGGTFVEIGKIGILSMDEMSKRRPDISYYPFDLGELGIESPVMIKELWRQVLNKIDAKVISPLPFKSFAIEDAANAFRFMAQAKQIGKVVITQTHIERASKSKKVVLDNRTYLLTGGLGALGLRLAEWLANKGARHLVLVSRSGNPTVEGASIIKKLTNAGVDVKILKADVADEKDVISVSESISVSMPPLGGIIHAAGVLDDGLIMNQTKARFENVMASKVEGTWNIHRHFINANLDFFICFSSISSVIGSAGQGNYAAANAFIDSLIQFRHHQGLPAMGINWGPWAEIGMAANLKGLQGQGIDMIKPDDAITFLDELIDANLNTQAAIALFNWDKLQNTLGSVPFYSNLVRKEKTTKESTSGFMTLLKSAHPNERKALLDDFIQNTILSILDMKTKIDMEQSVFDLGMDSLKATELRSKLQNALNCPPLSTTIMFENDTIEKLSGYLAEKVIRLEFASQPVS